jgi:hypothetical protein
MLNGGRSGKHFRPLLPPGHMPLVADRGAKRAVNKNSD